MFPRQHYIPISFHQFFLSLFPLKKHYNFQYIAAFLEAVLAMKITSISALVLLAAISGAAAYNDYDLYNRGAAAATYEDALFDSLYTR